MRKMKRSRSSNRCTNKFKKVSKLSRLSNKRRLSEGLRWRSEGLATKSVKWWASTWLRTLNPHHSQRNKRKSKEIISVAQTTIRNHLRSGRMRVWGRNTAAPSSQPILALVAAAMKPHLHRLLLHPHPLMTTKRSVAREPHLQCLTRTKASLRVGVERLSSWHSKPLNCRTITVHLLHKISSQKLTLAALGG